MRASGESYSDVIYGSSDAKPQRSHWRLSARPSLSAPNVEAKDEPPAALDCAGRASNSAMAMKEPDWLRGARIQAIAQTGLTFCRDPYDRERYEAIGQLAARMFAAWMRQSIGSRPCSPARLAGGPQVTSAPLSLTMTTAL